MAAGAVCWNARAGAEEVIAEDFEVSQVADGMALSDPVSYEHNAA